MPAPQPPDPAVDHAWDELVADLEAEDEAEGDDWVTLAEAEAAAGVSRSTLRLWYRTGQIPSRLVEGPHGPQQLVPRADVLARAAFSPGRPRRPDVEARVAELEARVAALEARLP